MNSSISSLQIARTRGSSFFMASGVNGGSSNCLAGLCSGGSEGIGGGGRVIGGGEGGDRRRRAGDRRTDVAHDDTARGEVLGVVGDLLYRFIGGRHVAAEEA